MNKTEAINSARKLEQHISGIDSGSMDAKTIHALLAYIALLEDQSQKILHWYAKYKLSFLLVDEALAGRAETELDDLITDLRSLVS